MVEDDGRTEKLLVILAEALKVGPTGLPNLLADLKRRRQETERADTIVDARFSRDLHNLGKIIIIAGDMLPDGDDSLFGMPRKRTWKERIGGAIRELKRTTTYLPPEKLKED